MRLLPPPLWLLIAQQVSANPNAPLPTAIRKMPPDAGEKFYHSYYAFDHDQIQQPFAVPAIAARQSFQANDDRLLSANASAELDFRPAFAPLDDRWTSKHEQEAYYAWRLLRRVVATLERGQWSCPEGTNNCLNIGYPNSCCPTAETCMVIQDTGLGPVGCCPTGSTCGGTISGCAPGNTPCGSDIGGGCCIPGYVCQGVGCVRSSTVIVPPSSTSSTSTSPSTTSTTPTSTTTTTPPPPSSTTTTPPTSDPHSTQSTSSPSAAVRPTSSPNPDSCPTGFYACSATHGGGCCQTGRDCQTTSCPPPASSTTLVDSGGLTVAVPATNVPATATGACAGGWFLCGAEAGPRAGCCPSGYGCGTASCSLVTAGATASVAKELPGVGSGGGRKGVGVKRVVVWVVVAVGVVW